MREQLAAHGGAPVRQAVWPAWPVYDEGTEAAVVAAVRARRGSVSWPGDGTPSRERQFAEAFAAYNGAAYGVSVDHGSSALLVALEALDVGPGDEVVVPTMTWVAPITAVLRVGALPVLADVDAATGCLTPEALRAALSPATKAAVVVHLGSSLGDVEGLVQVADDVGVALVEDCAQAHGARWRGRAVGTFGRLGTFSFQSGKVLSAGEGGAVITDDQGLYVRAQQLRADSRRYADGPPVAGNMEIVEACEVMGANYCMSELGAAVLLDQLPRLDKQHAHRERVAARLEAGLAGLEGLGPVPLPEGTERRSIYEYGVRFAPGTFGGVPAARVAEAVSAEIALGVFAPDDALHRSMMLRPETKRRFARIWEGAARERAIGRPFDGADAYAESTLLFHHSALLGTEADADDIVAALAKVQSRRDEL